MAFVTRENWIGVYGNSNGDINRYNTDGSLDSATVPGSSLPNLVEGFERILGQTFQNSEIILREGNIEDLASYTLIGT